MNSMAHTLTNHDTHPITRHCSHRATDFHAAHHKQLSPGSTCGNPSLAEELTPLKHITPDILDWRILLWSHVLGSR